MPPRIGMLNLTDPDLSSTSFYMTRGSSSPIPPTEVTGHGSDLAHRYQVLVLSFSVVGGCLAASDGSLIGRVAGEGESHIFLTHTVHFNKVVLAGPYYLA